MGKIIKKIVRVLLIIITALVVLNGIVFFILQTSFAQTFTINKITRFVTQKLGSDIRIEKVNYSFPRKLVLNDVLIDDLNGDTLLAVKKIDLRIKEINPAEKIFRFGKSDIHEPDFRIIKDTSGVVNLTSYINNIKDKIKRDTIKNTDISFTDIDIYDGSFMIRDNADTAGTIAGSVNFKDMRLDSVNCRLKDLAISRDSISMLTRGLTFSEAGGLKVRNLNMNATISGNELFFREVELLTDSSALTAERIFLMPADTDSWNDFINKVKIDLFFNRSVISTSDLSQFVSPIRGMFNKLTFSGKVSGTIAQLKGRNIRIDYAESTSLKFDFNISGLPSINDSYLYIDFTDMKTTAKDIEQLTLPGKDPLKLPAFVHNLGQFSYQGNFTGFTTDFVSFGTLITERGSFSTDISLKPEGKDLFSFKGFLQTHDVDLGYVTGNDKLFGGLWMHADVDGSMRSFKHLSASVSGIIDSVEVNRYMYRNINVAGTYFDRIWDGTVAIKDRNIKMDIMGRFDLKKTMPEFDFTMNLANADLNKLNLVNKDSVFKASALITSTFKGNSMNNLEGELRLINSTLQNSRGRLSIYDFLITSEIDNREPLLMLKSDFANAEIKGQYTIKALKSSAGSILHALFPSRFKAPEQNKDAEKAIFTIDTRIKKLDKLNDFLGTGLSISSGTRLTGQFISDSLKMSAELESDAITFSGTRLGKMHFSGNTTEGKLNIVLTADTLLLPDRSLLGNFDLGATCNTDTIDLHINWDNHDDGRIFGEVKAKGFFSRNEMNKPVLTIGILPTDFVVNYSLWNISPSRIVIDSTLALFDNILINSRTNFIRLNGKLSHNSNDRLNLSFEGLNISYLNNIIGKTEKNNNATEMKFEGLMKGYVTISDFYDDLLFESNISIADFMLNDNNYGLVTATSKWDQEKNVAVIEAFNDYEGQKSFDIKGNYEPSSKVADLTFSTYNLPLDILNPFVKTFASDLRGVGSGTVKLHGMFNQFTLNGSIMARDASLKIDFLQTRYSFSDSIRFNNQGILFKNIRIYDEKRNQGTINGILAHKAFKDINVSLDINMDKMLVLNTRQKDNDNFYGTAYASGYVGIKGNEEKMVFNISARTAPNTEFFIPLNTFASVTDYPFITFIDHSKKEENISRNANTFIREEKKNKTELNFDLEVTPEAEVQLIMDETSGGVIRGKGEGKLNISLNSEGDIRMSGDYVISDGDYLFTLGNILNKRFTVEEGGTISWNGAIDNATINIKAIYKTKASLADIYVDQEIKDQLEQKLPVECILSLSGKLLNPSIGFDINLPTADERTRDYLRMAIDTEEKLSKQFLYLLVMKSFYPDPSIYSSSSSGSGSQTYQSDTQEAGIFGVTTTTEMLSNQLSNWLSQISNDFDIGFNYRPGTDLTDQEVELALSTQFLNNKITLNGNVDVVGNQSSTKANDISGDFTIEIKLTDMLRFKVFNRSNYNLFYQVFPYTQGVGIFYRRDFNTFKDLFIKPEEKRKKDVSKEVKSEKK